MRVAVRVCSPALALQVAPKGGAADSPTGCPSTANSTTRTPQSSAASAVMATCPLTTPPSSGAVTLTVGGASSAHATTVTPVSSSVAVRPPSSVATALSACGPAPSAAVSQSKA